MELTFDFPGGARVDAHLRGFTIPTDQPPDATAPSPFDLFIASMGACAAYYILEFCRRRDIPTDGLRVTERVEKGPDKMVSRVAIDVDFPETFPEKYRAAAIRAADLCSVKRHLERPPVIEVNARAHDAAGAAA